MGYLCLKNEVWTLKAEVCKFDQKISSQKTLLKLIKKIEPEN